MLRKEHILSTSYVAVSTDESVPQVCVETQRSCQALHWVSNTGMSSHLNFASTDTKLLIALTTQQPACGLLLLPLKESDDRSKVKELMI